MPALDVLTDKVLNNRWDLKENAAELKAQADRIRQFHHSIFPNITLTAGYDLVEQGSHGVSGVFVMGSFPLPIFDHQQGNLAASKATQARLLSERVALEESIRRQIILQYQKLQASQIEWNQVKTQLIPLADQADQLALKDFSAGKSHLGDVLGQHQNAFSVQLASMDSYIRYQQALNDLEALLRDGINVAGLENNSEDTMDPDEDIPIEHSDDG